MQTSSDPANGVVDPNRLYTRSALLRILDWTPSGLRSAIRDGLKGHRVGKSQAYVGRDVIDWVTSRPVVKPRSSVEVSE